MIDIKLLQDLDSLPIPHFAFRHGNPALADPNLRPLIAEEARILGSITIQLETTSDENLLWALQVCIDHKRPIAIAVNPYLTRSWLVGTVPGDARPTDPDDVFYSELSMLRDRCDFMAGRIRRAAEGAKTIIDVGAILLDCERWVGLPGTSPEMNDALDRRYNDIYRIFKTYFPATPVRWYGGLPSGLFTGRELRDGWASVAYHTPEPWTMGRIIKRDREALHLSQPRVVMAFHDDGSWGSELLDETRTGLWISLGSCYRTGADGKKRIDWSGYDPAWSRNLAHYVREWNPAVVVPWPAWSHPFYVTEGKQSADAALLHFIKYVKGFGDA